MKKILVVEDDERLNKNIEYALSSEGYEVSTAFSISEAEERCSGVHLILLDVMLPDGNGMDFCRKLQEKERQPVIFLTSCDEEQDIVKGLDSGADDYLTKPFRLGELLSRVRAVFRRCYTEPEEDSSFTSLEQKLLEYLMLNREHFVTRDQILQNLWDSNGNFVNDNTLSVTISRLREKLTDGKIVTKRGVGYKWTQQTDL